MYYTQTFECFPDHKLAEIHTNKSNLGRHIQNCIVFTVPSSLPLVCMHTCVFIHSSFRLTKFRNPKWRLKVPLNRALSKISIWEVKKLMYYFFSLIEALGGKSRRVEEVLHDFGLISHRHVMNIKDIKVTQFVFITSQLSTY